MSTVANARKRPRTLGLPRNAVDFGPLVQRLARQQGPRVAAEYAAAVLKAQRDIDTAALERALRSGKSERVAQVLGLANIQQQVSRAVSQPLGAIAQQAGQGSAALLNKHGVAARFDAAHADVVSFARLQGSDLVTGIDSVTRDVIREVVARGAEGRLTVADQARAIREVVGLPKPWASAPARFEAELRAGRAAAATSRRLSAVMQGRLRKAIRTNTLTDALINEARTEYAAGLVNLRAKMIARTESARAAHHGLQEGWKQAQRDGVLPASTRRWWIVTPDERLSRTHATIPSLNPKGRRLDEPFVTTEGLHMAPPSRPNCRCRIALTFGAGELRDAERAAGAEIARRDAAAGVRRSIAPVPPPATGVAVTTGKAAMDMAFANATEAATLPEVKAALKKYVEGEDYYAEVNSYLRGTSGIEYDEDLQSVVDGLDDGFARVKPLSTDIIVYRGAPSPRNIAVGEILPQRGYVSTAFGEGAASDFAGAGLTDEALGNNVPTMFKIRVPEGTHAWGLRSQEAEILLPRGGSFRVTGRLPDKVIDGDTVRMFEVEYVPKQGQLTTRRSIAPGRQPPSAQPQTSQPLTGAKALREVPDTAQLAATDAQREAARRYTTKWHRPVNRQLRGLPDDPTDDYFPQASVDELKREMDKLFADTPELKVDIEVWRGTKLPDGVLKVGTEFVDNGFVSTSIDRGTAMDFVMAGDATHLVRIKVPQGSRAIALGPEVSTASWEHEVLLQRGGSFRVTAIDDVAKTIDMEYIPPKRVAPARKKPAGPVRHELGPEINSGAVVTDAQVEAAVEEATRLGVSPRAITFEQSLGNSAVGDFEGRVLGEFSKGRIKLVPNAPAALRQTVAHEATHLQWKVAVNADQSIIRTVGSEWKAFAKDDGITAYSRAHWQAWEQAQAAGAKGAADLFAVAIEETLAEMRAMQAAGRVVGTRRYQQLLSKVDDAYRKASQNGVGLPRAARRDSARRIKRQIEESRPTGLTGAKANKHLAKVQKDATALTEAQVEAHKNYQWYAYRPMNALMREAANDVDQFLSKSQWKNMDREAVIELANANRVLQAHIESMPGITEPVTVYRAIAPSGGRSYAEVRAEAAKWVDRLQPGARLTDEGFISTTTDYRQAEKWLRKIELGVPDAPLSGIVFEVQLPPGTKGVWAPTVTPEIAADVVVKNEFLLPPGGTFEVVSTTRDEARNWLRVVVRYIARGR